MHGSTGRFGPNGLSGFAVVGGLVLFLVTPAAKVCGAGCEVVSVSSHAEIGNLPSGYASISAEGRFVAFESQASNLVAGDTNGTWDVFVRDRALGTTQRVSVSTTGEQGNGPSRYPAISQDGTLLAFVSEASSLVVDDTNGILDVFIHNMLTGLTERVSVSSLGEEGNARSGYPPHGGPPVSISGDGVIVAFHSAASNLVQADNNRQIDVFVRDRLTRTTELVSLSSSGEQGNGASYCTSGALSFDGRYVAFDSDASNLAPGDANGLPDIFVYDRATRQIARITVSVPGECRFASLSGDARRVAFWSNPPIGVIPRNPRLMMSDLSDGLTVTLLIASALWENLDRPAVSGDGRYVTYQDSILTTCPGGEGICPYPIVAVYDTSLGSAAFVDSRWPDSPSLSASGQWVAFRLGSEGSPGIPGHVTVCDVFSDLSPPDTGILSGPCGGVVCSFTAGISWSATDNLTPTTSLAYSWRLDGGQWSAWTTDTSITLTGLADGQHVFDVKARDLNGNEDPTPAQCSFTVDASLPSVSIPSPAGGATVKGVVNISATASSASGIQRVEFYARGQLLCTDTSAPYSCEWDTKPLSVADGPAQICAKAFDSCGHSSQACITVTVDNTTFDDVAKTDSIWAYVEALVARGITAGCSSSPPLYCPYGNITRAQMAVFLCKAAGKGPLDRATPTFCDVPKTNPYYGWIESIADADSWGGSPPTIGCAWLPCKQYCPSKSVTRDEMAAFLVRATGRQPVTSCAGIFADVDRGGWACPFIERIADPASWPGSVAVTSGCAVNPLRYCPKSAVTRGQMAVFLVRAFGIPL